MTTENRQENSSALTESEPLHTVLTRAAERRATDIHLDPIDEAYRLCFRIDGSIQQDRNLDQEEGLRLVNQLKIMARFGTDRSFTPQESRATFKLKDKKLGLRVTLAPTLGREAIHIRFLHPPEEIAHASKLGMSENDVEKINKIMKHPEGLVLIVGPTGAGKTMTMYSLVSMLDLEPQVAVSVEDPVEFDLPYIRQLEVDEGHGLTMAQGLSTVLRMDPDLILVGEIRDEVSANIALRAAASGRFVFTTIHARDAATAIEILRNFGAPDHLLANTLRLVVTQDLVRKLCQDCRKERTLTSDEQTIFRAHEVKPPQKAHYSEGCETCSNTGRFGRTGVFQVGVMEPELRTAITSGKHYEMLTEISRLKWGESPVLDALEKTREGVISMEDVHALPWLWDET